MIKTLYKVIRKQLSSDNDVGLGIPTQCSEKDRLNKANKVNKLNKAYEQFLNQAQPSLLQELEPRLMFDGAAVETVDLADGVTQDEQNYILNAINDNDEAHAADSLLAVLEAQGESLQKDYSQFTEVVIIDARVKDPHVIINSISRTAAVEVILPEHDGVDKIAEILQKYQNLDAIHIVSHGDQAQLQLGDVNLNASNLSDYQTQLQQWGQALTQSGDILFYGCNVAEGEAGQAFVDELKALTDADIAASTDITGNDALGGDSILEYQQQIEQNQLITFNNYNQSLVIISQWANSFENAPNHVETGFSFNGILGVNNYNDGDTVSGTTTDIWVEDRIGSWGGPVSFIVRFQDYVFPTEVKLFEYRPGVLSQLGFYDLEGTDQDFTYFNRTELITKGYDDSFSSAQDPAEIREQTMTFSVSEFDHAVNGVYVKLQTGQDNNSPPLNSFSINGIDAVQLKGVLVAPPVLTNTAGNLTYIEDDSPTPIDATFGLTDPDDVNMASAKVTITNYVSGEDSLGFTPSGAIQASDGSFVNGVLTITRNAPIADYISVLNSITYENTSDDPSTAQRNIEFIVNDGVLDSNSINKAVNITSVNDAPVINTLTAADPTFQENGSAQNVFSAADIDFVEVSDGAFGIILEVSGLANGSDEKLYIDGDAIDLVTGVGTTITNAYDYNVTVNANTATISISKVTPISKSEVDALLNGLQYRNVSEEPSGSTRTVELVSIQDSGGTANGGVDLGTFNFQSTITINAVNDEPVVTSSGLSPAFQENGSAQSLFSGTSINLVESADKVKTITLSVNSLQNGADEKLYIDGQAIDLVDANSGTTSANSYVYSISMPSTTATITITKVGDIEIVDAQNLINGLQYENISDDIVSGIRQVRLVSVQDTGGTANGGDDLDTVNRLSTVTLTAINDTPVVSVTPVSSPVYAEDGPAQNIFTSTSINLIETNDKVKTIIFSVSNLQDGADEKLYIDGEVLDLVDSNSGTTLANGYGYSISESAGVATVTITKSGDIDASTAQNLIDNVQYANSSNNPTGINRTVELVSLQDSGGVTNGGVDTVNINEAVVVGVTSVNDAPSITSPTEAVLLQATSITFDAGQGLIQIADVDAGSNDIELSISVTNGILSLSQDTGLTYQGGTNNNEALITVQGTVSEINSALTNLVYTPTASFTGIATLTVNISDLGNDGTGGALTDNQVININVKAIADVSIVEMNIDDPGFDESNFVTLLVNKNATIAAGTQLRVNINETDRLAGTVIAEYNGSSWIGQNGATVSVGQTSANYETIIVEDPTANVENQGLIVHTTAHAVALVDASNVLELLSYKGNISFDYQGSTYLSTDIGLLSYSDDTDIVTTNSNVSLKRNLLNDDWQINRDSNFYAERGALPLWANDTEHEAIANPLQADAFISMFQYNPAGGPAGGLNNFVSIVVRDNVDFSGYKLVTDLADGTYSSGVNGTIIFDNTANVWSAQNGRSVESLAYATEGYTVYAIYGVDLNNTEGALVLLDNNDKPVDFISYGHEFEVTFGSDLYRSLIAGE